MLFLCLLLLTSPAFSDEGTALKRGEKAPYDGTLLSPDAIAQIITSADAELGQCKIDAKKDMDLEKSDFNYQLKMKEAELTACLQKSVALEALRAQQIDFLEKQVYKPKWTRSAIYIAGVLSGVGVVYLSAKIID